MVKTALTFGQVPWSGVTVDRRGDSNRMLRKSPRTTDDCSSTVPYRYEDLDDKSFQRLCAALLVHLDQTIQVPPLGQSDGGFDGYRRKPGSRLKLVGHQVKWTASPHRVKNPVTWVTSTLEGERANLVRMSSEGTGAYLLITNVPSTAVPKTGRMDQVDAAISRIGKEVGLAIYVWWRSDLDARLDSAPAELKFEYPNMLVGSDAMRALIADAFDAKHLKTQRSLLQAATRTQWSSDSTVGFRQGKLEGVPIEDLFVDVTATRRYDLARSTRGNGAEGALELLTSASAPRLTMIFGAPGQGKSTLLQMLCQKHRTQFLERTGPTDQSTGDVDRGDPPKVAFKVVLRDFAVWLSGFDPLEVTEKKRPQGSTDSIESFVAHVMHRDSGGLTCRVEDVVEIAGRFPSLFAFDGLDEVADTRIRERAVTEINSFNVRSSSWESQPQLVVTSRPSFSSLPEPSNDIFINFNLDPLSEKLRIDYLRRWSRSQELSSKDRHEVERIFRERSGEEHVRELATNPMQLTILLDLIHQRGDSVPQRRTKLYEDYLQSFLDREASKSATVKQYKDELQAITAFLGWHLQSSAESEAGNGRESRQKLIRLTKMFLVDNGQEKLVSIADELFTAVIERVWVLTSRVTGSFEFDVQAIREFFAAKYVFERAPVGREGGADIFERFMQVVNRPYWANTARFMAGMFRFGEKAHLADNLIEGLTINSTLFWPRRLSATLLRDGVFDDQPAPRRRLTEAASDRLGVRLALRDIESGTVGTIGLDRGGAELADLLSHSIQNVPDDALALERARLLSEYWSESHFKAWWMESITADKPRRSRWLHIGIAGRVGSNLLPNDLKAFETASAEETSLLLTMGASPAPESRLAANMLTCVLNGQNDSSNSSGRSLAASLSHTLALDLLLERTNPGERASRPWNAQYQGRFLKADPSRARPILAARKERAGQRGTSSMHAALADEVANQLGRCFLASEIALMGAAANNLRMGHQAQKADVAFGPASTPSALLRDLRECGHDLEWWDRTYELLIDANDQMTWLVAAFVCAPAAILYSILPKAGTVLEALSDQQVDTVFRTLALLNSDSGIRALPTTHVARALEQSADMAAMVILLLAGDEALDMWIDNRELRSPAAARLIVQEVWRRYRSDGTENAQIVATLTEAPADTVLEGSIDGVISPLLYGTAKTDGPWGLLRLRDSLDQFAPDSSPLREIAEKEGWFEPPT